MSCYISANDNRIYAAAETSYGLVPMVTSENVLPALSLKVKQTLQRPERKDKGGRTFRGIPAGLRSDTAFKVRTYMTSWAGDTGLPSYDALFVSAMGRNGDYHQGGTASTVSGTSVRFMAPHQLSVNQAVAAAGEIRFVTAVEDDSAVLLNAPLGGAAGPGTQFGPTLTYRLGARPRSATLFDYWSPADAIQRVVAGCVVDEFKVRINADYHEFEFGGPAAELIDSESFAAGQGGIDVFPAEPDWTGIAHGVIPGHLGQVWMGVIPEQMYTLTDAEVTLANAVDLRVSEFGQSTPRCYTAGQREVSVRFAMLETSDPEVRALYQAARQQMPVSVMFQLGRTEGQLCGFYAKSVVPEVPEFDDSDTRLGWKFGHSRAQGALDDELVIAFA